MLDREISVKAVPSPWGTVDFYVVEYRSGEKTRILVSEDGETYGWVEIQDHEIPTRSTIRFSFRRDGAAIQELVDTLYQAGYRPSAAEGSAGAMAATHAHLKDLQRLLFDDARTKPNV